MCFTKKCITNSGFIFSLLFGIIGVAGIIVAAVGYKAIKLDWTSAATWDSLGILTIVAVCIVVAILALGILQFCCCSDKCCYNIFVSYIIIIMH